MLYHQLDSLEEERANLASQCEELRLSLQQQRGKNAHEVNTTPQGATDSSVQTDPEEAGGTADSGTDSSSDLLRRLDSYMLSHLLQKSHSYKPEH